MRVDVTHLVLVALSDTNNHVGDQGLDGTESGNILACSVMQGDVDDVGGGALDE